MESIIRTRDFEIKKLKNNLKALGITDTSGPIAGKSKTDKLKKKVTELETSNEKLTRKVEKLKAKNKTDSEALTIKKELLATKNDEISKLKIEIGELKEKAARMLEEQKENEHLSKTLLLLK